LRTKAIEKTWYSAVGTDVYGLPCQEISYETSYKLKGDKYFLNHVSNYIFEFSPRNNEISLSGISFRVDSVTIDSKKVKKIENSQADPRKVNYIDHFIPKNNLKIDEK